MSAQQHCVFVLDVEGKPLTPTTSAKARKLLAAGVARKCWSKFRTFGIQLLIETRQIKPTTSLGIDPGTKFEGYAVVCGEENSISIKLDLPDKKQIVKKLIKRRTLRRSRRFRKCRRRPARFQNRHRHGFLAPSQMVILCSRLKLLRALFAIFPIIHVGLEDVRFNHAKHKWGANFSTIEIGKARLRQFLEAQKAEVSLFRGFDTKVLREQYGYTKTRDKAADKFSSHCSDALALASAVGPCRRVEPGYFLVVDDTYRPVRRKLHDEEPKRGGVRERYAHGTVFGLHKGLLIGAAKGKCGRLCGEDRGSYRYYDQPGKRKTTTRLIWISTQFVLKKGEALPLPAKAGSSNA
jgi:RRXRR protein